jgi:hypothetical protein
MDKIKEFLKFILIVLAIFSTLIMSTSLIWYMIHLPEIMQLLRKQYEIKEVMSKTLITSLRSVFFLFALGQISGTIISIYQLFRKNKGIN